MRLKFEIIVEEDGDRLWGRCEALKGFHVDGKDMEELERNAVEALQAYIASLKRHDEEIPVGCIVRDNVPRETLLDAVIRHFATPPRVLRLAVPA